MASGSQTCSGNWALLPIAPQNSSKQMAVICHCAICPVWRAWGSNWKTCSKFSVPTVVQMAMMPNAKPTSPTRLVRKAFLLASAALRL